MGIIANKYRVLGELGVGGYGTVYLVKHLDLGTQYALKLLSKDFSQNERLVELFRREAEALSRFSHPGCAQFRDFGKLNTGRYYMTTDYVEGDTLFKIIENEEWLPVMEALKIVQQILDVLEAAHNCGIIHRDVKPGNIMVQRDKNNHITTKLLDFGIAALLSPLDDKPEQSTRNEDDPLMVAGTPHYMSPEQAAGEENIDKRIDLYSLGVVLYEMLTGSVPFTGENVVSILVKHLTQPPAPFAASLGIPQSIEDLVMKALAKNPEQRFQSAAQFKEEIDTVLALEKREQDFRTATSLHETFVQTLSTHSVVKPVSGKQPPILCLDDNEMILNITRHILEKDGFRVLTATDFTVIYDYIFSEGCQLMLCDVEMPGLPGSKICQMLKKTQPDLKIVLFSNIHERDLAALAKESNADSWISKNTKPEHWLEEVKRVIAQ